MFRSLAGALLAVLATPALASEDRRPARNLACAAPTLFQCAVIVPGFTRYFFAPFGLAPSDAEMAGRVCREKKLPVSQITRRPTGSGPLSQTTAIEVVCGERPATASVRAPVQRPSPPPRPMRDFEGERLTLSGPDATGGQGTRQRRPSRSDRQDARLEETSRSRGEVTRSSRSRAKSEARMAPPERPRVTPEPKPKPAVAENPAPRPVTAPVGDAPKPSTPPAASTREPEKVGPSPAAPKSADPSIMYDHL